MRVKLIATVKLLVSPEERDRLLATMRRVNEACSWLAERAFEAESASIRDRVTVRKAQRATLHSWSFFQLRSFLTYKAALAGVALVAVDPRNTSRTCPECGNIDKSNRRSQAEFVCTGCGFAANADHVGARNIASRAKVIAPIGSAVRLGIEHVSSSPQLCQVQSSAL